ncbi:lysosomal membrane ascorbate-dependent ferrireductase CYB561A3 isoform X2 [Echeneis naucrates]|uniref:lysosomal membrane ascorbate-dependent ferrireductase CYB561A3 isoform X2 n=1 Tax=Echeneis naucrates TaxID=173247 RepID=UPI0011138E5A|nr:cytochrome b ascorbate-dependent protein 3 isoform X2 [Echeneis naucrates]
MRRPIKWCGHWLTDRLHHLISIEYKAGQIQPSLLLSSTFSSKEVSNWSLQTSSSFSSMCPISNKSSVQQAVLYRIPLTWGQNKLPWKLLHAALMFITLVLSIVGLCAVFDFHNANNISNLYSLHSWIGIAATALFALQWVVGVAGFLLPCSPVSLRKLLKPVHVWMGGSILSLSIVACISGINEKLFFVLKGTINGTQPYSKLPLEALLGNSLGVLIVAFGLVVLRILSNQNWQRQDSRPEDSAYTPLPQEEND